MSHKPQDIIILGAGGNSIAIADAIFAINALSPKTPRYRLMGFLDDLPQNRNGFLMGHPILGTIDTAKQWGDCKLINGIASLTSYHKRSDIIARSKICPSDFETIVHPRAVIAADAVVGHGCAIMANSVLCSQSVLGNHVLMLQNSTVNHHAQLSNFVTLSAGVTILGYVQIEEGAFIGGGAAIAPYIRIGSMALVGMGSAVIRDVAAGTVVAGNPARRLSSSQYSLAKDSNQN